MNTLMPGPGLQLAYAKTRMMGLVSDWRMERCRLRTRAQAAAVDRAQEDEQTVVATRACLAEVALYASREGIPKKHFQVYDEQPGVWDSSDLPVDVMGWEISSFFGYISERERTEDLDVAAIDMRKQSGVYDSKLIVTDDGEAYHRNNTYSSKLDIKSVAQSRFESAGHTTMTRLTDEEIVNGERRFLITDLRRFGRRNKLRLPSLRRKREYPVPKRLRGARVLPLFTFQDAREPIAQSNTTPFTQLADHSSGDSISQRSLLPLFSYEACRQAPQSILGNIVQETDKWPAPLAPPQPELLSPWPAPNPEDRARPVVEQSEHVYSEAA